LPTGKIKVNVTSDSHGSAFLTTPPELDASDPELFAWLSGGRVDLVFGGLGSLASGAIADADVSLYAVLASDADHLPPQSANAFGTEQVTQAMLMPMTDVDDDCDGAPNQWDPAPQGAPPPLLTGLPPGPVHIAVGSPATFKVAANQTGVTFTWAASDPSVAVTSAMGGAVAAATPGQPGLFHIDVVGSNGTTSSRMSWDLIAEPPSVQAANTPPHVAIGASAMTVRAGERVVLNAYGKDAEQAQLTFAWFTDDTKTLSAQLGSSVVFAAATPGDYKIGCIANDGIANSAPAVVVISVISPTANRPPGPPVVTPTSVVLQHDAGVAVTLMLQASASDPDGDAVTYDFAPDRFMPPTFTLTKDGAVASFATTQDGLYLFYVAAQDSHGVTGAWTPVKIQVMPKLTAMPVDADKDGYPAGIDCNDNDPTVFPGAKEICGDTVDQNCDGRDLAAADCDADGDRFTTNQGDCDDKNPTISPGAIERCDGIDNNCNGKIDEGFGLGVDCSAGAGACRVAATTVCNASFNGVVCGGKPGQPQPETCDGVDNDCNGQIDDVSDSAGGDVNNCGGCNVHCKAPANGVAACLRGGCTSTCAPGWVDTDNNPDNGCECQVSNGGVEICDGVDNDCNGSIDDGGGAIFYDGPSGSLGIGICRSGARSCQGGQPVTLRAQQLPSPEICDGLDNDCNGTVDDGFDLTKDPRNCGGCGIVCADGKCEGGKCTGGVIGPPGGDGSVIDGSADAGTGPGMGTFVICNGATGSICTDLSWDPANCGSCGRACPSGLSCGGGVCVDPASTCPLPKLFCKDSVDPAKTYCTDPMFDPGNCGGCGNRCASGYCQAGVCQTSPVDAGDVAAPIGDGGSASLPTCDPTHLNICPLPAGGGYCTNFMSDPGNCGGCAKTCPAGLACNAGLCSSGAAACAAPLSSCGTSCTSFGDDPANCGHCGNTCPGGVCQAALCAVAGAGKFGDPCGSNTSCGGGMMCMDMARFGWPGGFCSTPCGASRPCGSGQSCVIVAADSGGFGTCRPQCATDADCGGAGRGYLCSSGTCGPDCRTAPMACNKGQVCDAGGHCVPGAGGTTGCAAPLVTCMTATQTMFCTDLSKDPANCGVCGKLCPTSTVCNAGTCQTSSGGSSFAGMAACTGTNGAPICTNIYNDAMNCGACGVICQGGTYCQGGICAAPPTCPATNMLCGDPATGKRYCTDITIDSANCGVCGVICQGGTYCQAGACVPGNPTTTCQPPYKTCSDPLGKMICLRVDSDPSNCGGCGNQCPAGSYCQNYTCMAGTTNPDGGTTQPPNCTDPMTKPCPNATGTGYYCAFIMGDPSNCGGCGYTCPSGVCQNYACVPGGTADGGAPINCPVPSKPCLNRDNTMFCADVSADSNNCGGCGSVCQAGTYCLNYACTGAPPPDGGVTCAVPLFACKDAAGNLACVDRSYDSANCGACGNVCPANTKCTNAQCVVIQ
jgi:hypothetical protein